MIDLTDLPEPWALKVLKAFRDEINRHKPEGVPDAFIGWPRGSSIEGSYAPFVWFENDPLTEGDGVETHEGTPVVTGMIFKADRGNINQTDLEQGMRLYYEIHRLLMVAARDNDSDFNQGWPGIARPAPSSGGITPSDAADFDAEMSIGERWLVTGAERVLQT